MPMTKHTSPRQMRGRMSSLMCSGAYLAVGDEVQAHRRVRHPKFLGDHIALEEAALVPAVFLRPRHADPASGADATGERGMVQIAVSGLVRVEGSGRDLLRNECAHLLPQRVAFRWQTDLIETKVRRHTRSEFRPDRPSLRSGGLGVT
jgi:hypothetical protein